jgi:hypothetical protein
MRETKKTRIDGVHEERAGRRDVVKASLPRVVERSTQAI